MYEGVRAAAESWVGAAGEPTVLHPWTMFFVILLATALGMEKFDKKK
jgi:hypothetical protein